MRPSRSSPVPLAGLAALAALAGCTAAATRPRAASAPAPAPRAPAAASHPPPATAPAPNLPDEAPAGTAQVRLYLLADSTSVAPGATLRLAARFDIAPGWHIYWKNPGDAGLATDAAFSAPAGFRVGKVAYPGPQRFDGDGGLVSYGYRDLVLLPVQVVAPRTLDPAKAGRRDALRFAVSAHWLACRDACVPGHARAAIDLPVAGPDFSVAPVHARLFARLDQELPRPLILGHAVQVSWSRRAGAPLLTITVQDAQRLVYFPLADEELTLAGQAALPAAGGRATALELEYRQGLHHRARAGGVLAVTAHGQTRYSSLESGGTMNRALLSLLVSLAACGGCATATPAPASRTAPPAGAQATPAGSASMTARTGAGAAATPGESSPLAPTATPSAPSAPSNAAPGFTLKDLDGHDVSLASFRGKTVVLEWFNPRCPFVRYAHGSARGPLRTVPARHIADGIVWLAVNSSAPGHQGANPTLNRQVRGDWNITYPILLDPTGAVGHAYHATSTPTLVVIDPAGAIVYRGALDNAPLGRVPDDGGPVIYVNQALAQLAAHQPITPAETHSYGCSVKYAR